MIYLFYLEHYRSEVKLMSAQRIEDKVEPKAFELRCERQAEDYLALFISGKTCSRGRSLTLLVAPSACRALSALSSLHHRIPTRSARTRTHFRERCRLVSTHTRHCRRQRCVLVRHQFNPSPMF